MSDFPIRIFLGAIFFFYINDMLLGIQSIVGQFADDTIHCLTTSVLSDAAHLVKGQQQTGLMGIDMDHEFPYL